MCGIAGRFSWRRDAAAVDNLTLSAMAACMRARGPDGEGHWSATEIQVAFVHRRLAIIDLSPRGAQPMSLPQAGLTITYNGEIYNYRELRRELESAGAVFRSDCDTEVLLHLYAQHGSAMLTKLRGMFALAIWDERRQQLLLARDSFGIKPLYYGEQGGTVYFASQVKALLHAPLDTTADNAGRAGFLLWGSVPEPWTLFRGICSLPAGHSLTVSADGIGQPVPFQVVSDLLRAGEDSAAPSKRADALHAIADAVRNTVRAHHVADVPVGVFLSAGLDSAMLALATAGLSEVESNATRTLTLGFDEYAGGEGDETSLAAEIARLAASQHQTTWVHRAEFEAEGPAFFAAMDQPSIDGVNTWFVSRAARAQLLKVALSGLGGDEVFASYPSFRQVPQLARRLRALSAKPWLGRAIRRAAAPWIGRITSPKYAGLAEYGGTLEGTYLLRRALFMPWELPALMGNREAAEGLAALDTLARVRATHAGITSPRLAMSALEMQWYMRHQLLRDADWAGMAHSLEIRVPFVDVEFLRRVAPLFARFPDIDKSEVARAVAPALPASVLARPKTGFVVPVREWITTAGDASTLPGQRGLRGWALRCIRGYPSFEGPQSPSQPQRQSGSGRR